MIGVDTNVVVGLITNQPAEQADLAEALLAAAPVYVPATVVLEAEWVLRSQMGFSRLQAVSALKAFAGLPNVRLEAPDRIGRALEWGAARMDLADALHLAASDECEAFASFDRDLIRSAVRVGAMPPVIEP